MNKKHIFLLASLSFIAFFLGYMARAMIAETATDSLNNRITNDGTYSKDSSSEGSASPRVELDETNRELEESIDALTRELAIAKNKAARFDCMSELLRDRGNQAFLGIGFDRFLAPRNHGLESYLNLEQISKLFGLSENGQKELGSVVAESLSSIQAWEEENAVLIEENGTYSYEIPPVPEKFKKQFLDSLGTLLGSQDLSIVGPAIDELYSTRLGKRNVLIKVEAGNGSPMNDALVVQVSYETEGGAHNTEGHTTNIQDIPERWRHLFVYGD